MKSIFITLSVVGLTTFLSVNTQAGIPIPMSFTTSDSVHTFPDALRKDFWEKLGIKAEAKGTARPIDEPSIGGNSSKFNYPVTSILINHKMKIELGRANGTVMVYSRLGENGKLNSLTLSNFSIDYKRHHVLADATYGDGKKQLKLPIFDFSIETPLNFHYRFPIGIISYEKLNRLYLTDQAKSVYQEALDLPNTAIPLLSMDFGTLTQSGSSKIR
ncbi:hypothetical protein [Acinetobacter sp. XH1639]|uniref:hypothetical protein n=1 Tax=Acinetobacter sp. XH1639 TaxID=3157368 RepID=UPI0032B5E070